MPWWDQKIPDFPYYHEAIRFTYQQNPKRWSQPYKFLLLKGANQKEKVEISLNFLINSKTFHRTGLQSPVGIQLLVAYLTKQANEIMENSKIGIQFKIHCVHFALEKDWNSTYKDSNGQIYDKPIGDDPEALLYYYNIDYSITSDTQRNRTFSSDITILIRDDFGDQVTLSVIGGIQTGRTSVFVRPEFILEKYNMMHAIGHMIGCGHQSKPSKKYLILNRFLFSFMSVSAQSLQTFSSVSVLSTEHRVGLRLHVLSV